MGKAKPKAKAAAETQAGAEEKARIIVRADFTDSRRKWSIDFLDLTFEEKVIVEEHFNKPWEVLMAQGWVGFSEKGKILLAWLVRRRDNASYTLEDTFANLKKVEAKVESGEEGDEADPPTGASRSNGSRS
jgi:hypothetical protein